MLALVLATLFLVMTHLVPSAPGLRPRLVARWGLHGFRLGYSLLSLAALAWVVLAYRAADPGLWLYAPPGAARILAVALMPVALLLILCRLTTPPRGREPVGIYRITATPGSLGVLLWCGLHLLNLGAVRSLVLFSGMALIAAGAIVANLRRAPPAWAAIGPVPFAAILAGRERLVWREIGWQRPVAALLLTVMILRLHPLVIGRDPLAGLIDLGF